MSSLRGCKTSKLRPVALCMGLAAGLGGLLSGLGIHAQAREKALDYYVSASGSDRGDGSAKHPWKTIARAAEAARPGTTVHVLPGIYLSDAELKTSTSGTANQPLRYVSEVRWGAKLVSSKQGNSAVWWNEGDHVTIEGFDISGRGALGIYNTGSYVRILGNNIHDIAAERCPAAGGGGINNGNYAASGNEVVGNWVHDVGEFGSPCPRVHGIYHSNLGGAVRENVVFRNQGWGIHLWHAASGVKISRNIVFNNSYGGILVGAVAPDFPAGKGAGAGTLVENNIIVRNGVAAGWRALLGLGAGGYGVLEYGDVGLGNRFRQNILYENKPRDIKTKLATDEDNILKDPLFTDYQPDGTGDYRLKSTSPACTGHWRHPACSGAETTWKATP